MQSHDVQPVPPPPSARRRPAVGVVATAVAVALLVVALGVERVSASRAEAAVEAVVADALDRPVQVAIHGTLPGLSVLLTGRIARLDVAAQDVAVPAAGVVIDDLSVVLTDLRLDGEDRPVAGEGRFTAAFGEAQVRAAAPAAVRDLLVLDGRGLRIDLGLASVPLELTVVGAALEVGLPGEVPLLDDLLGQATRVPLDVPDGVVVVDASITGGRVELSGVLDPVVVSR